MHENLTLSTTTTTTTTKNTCCHSTEECEVATICGTEKVFTKNEGNYVSCWLKTVRQDDHACCSIQPCNSIAPALTQKKVIRKELATLMQAWNCLCVPERLPSQSVSSGLRQTARAGVRAHLSLSCRSTLLSPDGGFAAAFWIAAVLGVADPAQPHGFVPSDMNRSRQMKRRAYTPLLSSTLARLRSGWHWKWSRRNYFEAKLCIQKTSRSR